MNDYKVSILVPIYGVEKYIERCAVSLFEQTYGNIEYVFVNDCTKDNSINILNSVAARYPKRKEQINIIHHDVNKGLGAARNTAVQNSTGEFIVHVDSDDYVEFNFVQLLVEKQIQSNSDVVSCNFEKKKVIVDFSNYNHPIPFIEAILKYEIPNNIWGRLIRRSLYVDNAIMVSDGVNMSEDINVLPRLVYYANKIDCVNKCLYHYEIGNGQSYTSTFDAEKGKQSWITNDILETFFKDKNNKLYEALKYRIAYVAVRHLINSVRGDGNPEYYRLMKSKLNGIHPKYYSKFSLPIKIGLKIPFYNLFRIYMKLSSILK